MKTKTLALILHSPAFLGNAVQSAVWRTPPLKALLREWWRVASAPRFGYDHAKMREAEGLLFGNAWLEPTKDEKGRKIDRFCKSQVRMALENWDEGKRWDYEDVSVSHQEVKFPIGSQLYLGYGALTSQKNAQTNKSYTHRTKATLQAGNKNTLDLAFPDDQETVITQTLQLMDWFGTVGGRSRNGWGSLDFKQETLLATSPALISVLHPLKDCLKKDWAHAIGKDEKGALVWESADSFTDWKVAMQFLARTKIAFRTSLQFTTGNNTRTIEERHILAYPVTNHAVAAQGWGGQARLANQLRFKLFRDAQNALRARIYHTPHKCPLPLNGVDELTVWQKIHRHLDTQNGLKRLGATK